MEKIKGLFLKYREQISYLFFGGCTTLINIAVYWLCAHPLNLGTQASNVIAWVLSVLFAYVTNRIWVFQSREKSAAGILREMVSFFGARLATGLLDQFNMWLFVDTLHLPDMPVKVVSNVVVILLNYVFSKLIIFRKKQEDAPGGANR